MPVPLHAVLYQSQAARPFDAAALDALVAHAAAHNADAGLTGVLYYGEMAKLPGVPGLFLQWLEGPEASLATVFARIRADRRHVDLRVVAQGPVEALTGSDARLFPTWAMTGKRLSDMPATLHGFLETARQAA